LENRMKFFLVIIIGLLGSYNLFSSHLMPLPDQKNSFDEYVARVHPHFDHKKINQLEAATFDKIIFAQFATMLKNHLPKELVTKILNYCIDDYTKSRLNFLDKHPPCSFQSKYNCDETLRPPLITYPFIHIRYATDYNIIKISRYEYFNMKQSANIPLGNNTCNIFAKDQGKTIFKPDNPLPGLSNNFMFQDPSKGTCTAISYITSLIQDDWKLTLFRYPHVFLTYARGYDYYKIINVENPLDDLAKEEAQKLLIKNGLLRPQALFYKDPHVPNRYLCSSIDRADNSHIYINNKKLICERNRLIEIWSLKQYPPQLLKTIDVGFQSLTSGQYSNYACWNNILVVQREDITDFWDIRTGNKLKTQVCTYERLYDFVDGYLIFTTTSKNEPVSYNIYPLVRLSLFLAFEKEKLK